MYRLTAFIFCIILSALPLFAADNSSKNETKQVVQKIPDASFNDDYIVGLKAFDDGLNDVAIASFNSYLAHEKKSKKAGFAIYLLYQLYMSEGDFKSAQYNLTQLANFNDSRFNKQQMLKDQMFIETKLDCSGAKNLLMSARRNEYLEVYAKSSCPMDKDVVSLINKIDVSFSSKAGSILVCKNGYKPNANGDNCEPINRELCPESIEDMRAALCTGWTDMDENIHDFKLDATKNCYQFRCINNKEAFVSGADRTCAECVTSPRNGVSPVNGVCIRCDKGKIFDANAKSSGYCTDTTGYTKTDMMYGKGKTKNSVQNIDDQCWPLITPDEYKECVTGQSNASSDTIIRTNSQQLR